MKSLHLTKSLGRISNTDIQSSVIRAGEIHTLSHILIACPLAVGGIAFVIRVKHNLALLGNRPIDTLQG